MKPYEKYKASEIEWLGEIPEHWEVKRVKDLTSKIGSGVTPSGGAEVYLDSGIPFFRSQNIHNNRLSIDDIVYISEDIDKSMSNSRIRPNDILLNITGASIGRCFYAPANFKKGNVNQHVCIIRPIQKKITTNFLHFEIISQYGQILIDISQNGANREGLNFQQIKNFVFPIPSINEQTEIASYLDTKTTAIDRKIELLTAKADKYKALRRSLINETVCRGLNPDAPMKDSGVEWVGKIPEHWEVKRLKSLGDIETSSVDKKIIENEALVKLVNYTDVYGSVKKEIWNRDDYMIVSANDKQLKSKRLRQGNVLFTPSSETITDIGVSAVIMENLENTLYSYHILRFNFLGDIDLQFKKYLLNNDFVQYYFSKSATGTTRKILGLNTFWNLPVILPPFNEQILIGKFLNEKTALIDNILTNTSNQISKLTQLRKTLINDVVTGKIKVTED